MIIKHVDLESRFGKFEIKRHLIDDTPNQVFQILQKFLVVEAVTSFASNTVVYTALSTLFDMVEDGHYIPTYELTATYLDDELVDLEVARK